MIRTFGYILRASAEEIDNVKMFAKMYHDLQLARKSADIGRVRGPTNHFYGNRSGSPVFAYPARFRLHYHAKCTATQLFP